MPTQIPAHSKRVQPRSPLVRILGLGFGVAVIFGGTVGVGILRLPGTIAGELRSFWLILVVWAAGATYALLGAISLSELGTAMPQGGGFYIYARRAFGPAVGFATGWADWLNNCAVAYGAVTAAEYLGALFAPLAAWPNAVALGAGGTPVTAMLLSAGMAGLLAARGRFDEIVAIAAILVAGMYAANYVAVFVLRVREPEMARHFRALGYLVTTGLVLVGSVVFLVAALHDDSVSAWRAGGAPWRCGSCVRMDPVAKVAHAIMNPRGKSLFRHAIVRTPGSNFDAGLTTASLGKPVLEKVLKQHAQYCAALEECGLELIVLEADLRYPDSTSVEDTAVISPRGAILMRPGAKSRAGEVEAIRPKLERFFPAMPAIEAPGTVDGGDICEAGEHFILGLSHRTNEEGARQLAARLVKLGYSSCTVDVRPMTSILHLKSGITYIGQNTLVVMEAMADNPVFAGFEILRVSQEELRRQLRVGQRPGAGRRGIPAAQGSTSGSRD